MNEIDKLLRSIIWDDLAVEEGDKWTLQILQQKVQLQYSQLTLRHSLILPGPQWSEQTSEDTSTIQICKIQSFSTSSSSSSSSTSTLFQLPVVTHSVTVYEDRTWIAFVHGHQIDHKRSPLLSSIPDEKSLENLLSKMNQCMVCPGHPDDRFIQMALSKRGKKSWVLLISMHLYA